jgi:glycosyltransferase involved in cell wall biosynthesis
LFSKVDHHIHYFRDLTGYERIYGIGPNRSSFVPFKANLLSGVAGPPSINEGEYILCFGRSMRDYETFFDAMEKVDYIGAIPDPNPALLRAHGARFNRPLSSIPSNVRILPDFTSNAEVDILMGARIVVLPILRSSIAASGISTCLNAMLLGKCVIASAGPGISDIFSGEVITVPPEDSDALSSAIKMVLGDNNFRRHTALRGHEHAKALGGEPEFYQRVIDAIVTWMATSSVNGGMPVTL